VEAKMRIKKCKECGFSYWLSKYMIWNDNGTITGRGQPNFRILITEADYLSEIFKEIEQALGVPIGHVVFEAQRIAAKEVLDINLRQARWPIRHLPGVAKLVIVYMDRLALWTGQAYSKKIVSKANGIGEAIIRNPFNRELFAAIVVGAMESLYETPFSYYWKNVGGDDVIRVEPISERPKISERLAFTTPTPKPGIRRYKRCPKCGVPILLKDMQWREEEGQIIDTRRDVRVVVLDIYTTIVVLRELARELGDDIYPIIVDAMRKFSLERIRKEYLAVKKPEGQVDKDGFYRDVLDSLALYGQGNPVSNFAEDDKLTVFVENPFSEYILAGHLSALYELVEGKTPKVNWDFLDPSTVVFELTA
jgi:hypothetical protein